MPLFMWSVKGDKGDKGDIGNPGVGAQGIPGSNGLNGSNGDTMVKRAWNYNTNSSGVWTGSIPSGASVIFVTPRTPGEFNNSISITGETCTVTFRKFKSAGLGITLGTLLSVSVFETTPGVVNFDLTCMAPVL